MRFCTNKILVLSIAVMTVFVSLLQYHHHSCDGTIYFAVSETEDIVIGSSRNHLTECNHEACPHDGNATHGGHKCAMHVTSGDIISSRHWQPDYMMMPFHGFPGYCIDLEIWESLIRIIFPQQVLLHTGKRISQNKLFRGPPMMFLNLPWSADLIS